MKTAIILTLALLSVLFLGCAQQDSGINSFEDCVNAGYPVMESYPRQCATPDGTTFTEQLKLCVAETGESMTLDEAKEIASESECTEQGTLKENSVCNFNTGTWWIDLEPSTLPEGCNPACVVNVVEKTAEINWRCTGIID